MKVFLLSELRGGAWHTVGIFSTIEKLKASLEELNDWNNRIFQTTAYTLDEL